MVSIFGTCQESSFWIFSKESYNLGDALFPPSPPSDRISGSAAIRLWTISKAPSPIYFRTCTCGPKTQFLDLLGLFLTFLAPFLAHLVQNHQKIALGAWQTTNWLNFFGRLQKGLCHRLPLSRFPCCVLLALSWNTTNENPNADKSSRVINYSPPAKYIVFVCPKGHKWRIYATCTSGHHGCLYDGKNWGARRYRCKTRCSRCLYSVHTHGNTFIRGGGVEDKCDKLENKIW